MDILNTVSLESNTKINFDGGDLSSDAGLLLLKEFLFKIGAVKLFNRIFKTNDTAWFRIIHKDDANLLQVIYQIISAYFEDDCADELTGDLLKAELRDGTMYFYETLENIKKASATVGNDIILIQMLPVFG